MKSLLIIAYFLTSLDASAQIESQILFEKGYDNFYGTYIQDSANFTFKNNIDSSLYYLIKLSKKFPNYKPIATNDIISLCYFDKKDFDKSLSYALKVLSSFKTNNIESDNYCFECNSACNRIGYIYQTRKEFEKALSYYDSCATKYKTFPLFCSISYYSNKVPQDYNLFTCYQGLGQSKRALTKLTEYLFDSTINEYLDTAIVNDYVKLISTLYSKTEIKNNIQTAIDSMYYKVEIKRNKDGIKYDYKISCWFNLFGSKVILTDAEGYGRDTNEVDFWNRKENFIERIKKSDGYKRLYLL